MKKDEKGKARRLHLNRETIQALNDPALLELVRSQFKEDYAVTSWPQTTMNNEGAC